MSTSRFRTSVNVRISQLYEYPPGSGQWALGGSNGLEISESFDLADADFLQLAGILGRFHELAERVRREAQEEAGNG